MLFGAKVLGLTMFSCLAFGSGAGQQPGTPVRTGQEAVLVPRDGSAQAPVSEKQKAIQADSEKLVRMAAELKVSVDKSNKNELSVDVVRKAEAIEALAKSLKARMREPH